MRPIEHGPRSRRLFAGVLCSVCLTLAGEPATAADSPDSGGSDHAPTMLQTDSMGRLTAAPTNQIPGRLLPSRQGGLQRQIPRSNKGTRQPEGIRERLNETRTDRTNTVFFPSVQPHLPPYLATINEYGNTAAQPGPVFQPAPFEAEIQGAKYWLSDGGFRYFMNHDFTGVGMSNVRQGNRALAYYSLELEAKWAVFESPGSMAGWISAEVAAKSGLGTAGADQSARLNLGTLTQPSGNWSSINGMRLPEMAWMQSLRDGEWVLVAGMVDQSNYLDANGYANTPSGQFLNSALINSQVLPLNAYNWGAVVQWQPHKDWYVMLGGSAGNGGPRQSPWEDFDWNTWSILGELGYAPEDFLGWGPGVYRVQPFVSQSNGPAQAGVGFNIQQQLGADSPFGWFGRFGFGGNQNSGGFRTQIGTGFVTHAPLFFAGLMPERTDDLAGLGFVWSRPSDQFQTIQHENEFVLETFYALQVTPMLKFQPDVQVVWNPAFNPDPGPAAVVQLQVVMTW